MSNITLARMKKIPNKDELLGYIKNLKHREIKFEVKEFILKKSTLTPEGPIYEDIMTFNLNN
jgi:2'-5' RNA ligase